MTRSQSGRRLNAPLGRLQTLGPFHIVAGTTLVFALLLVIYLAIGIIVVPLMAVVAVAVGVDRVVRMHPQWRFSGLLATAPYLFLPTLLALSATLALGESDSAAVKLVIGPLIVLLVAVSASGEFLTVDPAAESYEIARFLLLFSIYVTALSAFSLTFITDLPLALGVASVFAVTLLLTADMIREIERESTALWILAGAAALVMAECRWVASFLSLSDVVAAVFMLFVYYPMTGLVQEYVAGRAERQSWITWGVVFATGMVVLLLVRVFYL